MTTTASSAAATARPFLSMTGLLGIVFAIAKILKLITWSWWLVLLPFYIVPAVAVALLVLGGLIFGLVCLVDYFITKRDQKRYAALRAARLR